MKKPEVKKSRDTITLINYYRQIILILVPEENSVNYAGVCDG